MHPCTGSDALYRPYGPQGEYYSLLTTALERGEVSASRPGRSLPPRKTRYPLYRRLGGPQGRSGQRRKISPPPGFDPRTVQPVASRYNDWATRPSFVYGYTTTICPLQVVYIFSETTISTWRTETSLLLIQDWTVARRNFLYQIQPITA